MYVNLECVPFGAADPDVLDQHTGFIRMLTAGSRFFLIFFLRFANANIQVLTFLITSCIDFQASDCLNLLGFNPKILILCSFCCFLVVCTVCL